MAKQDGLVNQQFHSIAQKKAILVMDDQIERHDLFLKFIGPDFDSVYTGEAMLSLIEGGDLTAQVLFWDHDLGLYMNGTQLLRELIRQNLKMPSVRKIFVHSANGARNNEMVEDLRVHYPDIKTYITPISYLTDEFKAMKNNREEFKAFLLGD